MKIDTLTSVGMSILIPDMLVMTILSQSICIILKQQLLVTMQTFSFGICHDNLIDVAKYMVKVKAARVVFHCRYPDSIKTLPSRIRRH